ncbi:response regulator [Aquidulcibacter sp.]|uniref:response regulator n=1 Tax=Aquidulcibacter sp. TaxID=2052990 RepID=UPI0025BF456F|nr:response regulator [Aquidulcibacter sp.]MCA3691876.1 response regulator [Aquidulcibacter sp.]
MPGLNSLHVLVVDDNPHMRSIVVAILRGVGIGTVKEASDGADAMEVMRAGVPDIVIVDLNMFPIDGLEFTQMIRTAVDSPFPFVPIIMMTGHTERTKVTAARDSGVNELVAKPISAKTLLDRIVAVIDRPRAFVKTATYTGPCRRRGGNAKDYVGKLRRKSDNQAKNDQPNEPKEETA